MSENNLQAPNIDHITTDRSIPKRCSLCERRGKICTVTRTSARCLACVGEGAACSFTAPSMREWNNLTRAEKTLEEKIAVVDSWLKAEVSNLELQLAQLGAARLVQTPSGKCSGDVRVIEASAQLLREERNACELMVTMLNRKARLRKQQDFLEVRGKEMLRRGLAVLDEEDAMDWEEYGEQGEDEEIEADGAEEEENQKSRSDAKTENDPAESNEDLAAFEKAVSPNNIPAAVLNEPESFREDRENCMKQRLTHLLRIIQLEEKEANLPVRLSKMVQLGLPSLEELDRIEREENTKDNKTKA